MAFCCLSGNTMTESDPTVRPIVEREDRLLNTAFLTVVHSADSASFCVAPIGLSA